MSANVAAVILVGWLHISSWLCFPVWQTFVFHITNLRNEGLWSFFFFFKYKISNWQLLCVKNLLWACSAMFAFITHLSHHQHERRSHLLEVYGARWWGRHSWMQPRYCWRRSCARAGSSSAACAPAACGSEEAGQGTLWNEKWQFFKTLKSAVQHFGKLRKYS